MDVRKKIATFPRRPGVYLFSDTNSEIIYVGKAKNLRARVKQYFGTSRDERPQIRFLMNRVRDIDCIVTDTEKEALLLENTLIKKHQPRYNLMLKDDKTFISIRMGFEHPWPGIGVTRHPRKDGARYFGPYASGMACRDVIDEIIGYFKIRSCTDRDFANRVRPCLLYDIGRCTAPCVEEVTPDDYRQQVDDAVLFLEGRHRTLMGLFRERMRAASVSQRYEEAARYRDLISAIEGMVERQKVVRHGAGDRDAVGLAVEGKRAAVCVLFVRGGTLVGKRVEHLGRFTGDEAAAMESFLIQWYGGPHEIPSEIVTSHAVEGRAAIGEILTERRGGSVHVRQPRKSDALGLVRLAVDNAREHVRLKRDDRESIDETLDALRTKLALPRTPEVIECLDISNIQGRDAYGSLVTFVGGEPDKTRYRLYRIRSIGTPNDYQMMQEVLERRFRPPRIGELGRDKHREPPDLLLVDGGKGQLGIARRVLDDIGLEDLRIAAIAKGESKGRETDDIYVPGRMNPLNFRKGSRELFFLMRIRDEAHRFGISAHRRRRIKNLIQQG